MINHVFLPFHSSNIFYLSYIHVTCIVGGYRTETYVLHIATCGKTVQHVYSNVAMHVHYLLGAFAQAIKEYSRLFPCVPVV